MVVKVYGNHGYEKELEKSVMVNLGKKTLIEVNHHDPGLGNSFLDDTPKHSNQRKNTWTQLHLNSSFCASKDTIKRVGEKKKTSHRTGENICKSNLTRISHPEYTKNSYNSAIKRQPSFFNGQRIWIDIFP